MTPYTTQPPTEPGWYWCKHRNGFECIVRVIEATNGNLIGTDGSCTFALTRMSEWGPKVPSAEWLMEHGEGR